MAIHFNVRAAKKEGYLRRKWSEPRQWSKKIGFRWEKLRTAAALENY
jgi:hypothetical protein